MKKIKGFRVWLTSSSDYGILEKPIDIFFRSRSEAEKAVKYLNSKRTSINYAYIFRPGSITIYKTAQDFIDEKEIEKEEK